MPHIFRCWSCARSAGQTRLDDKRQLDLRRRVLLYPLVALLASGFRLETIRHERQVIMTIKTRADRPDHNFCRTSRTSPAAHWWSAAGSTGSSCPKVLVAASRQKCLPSVRYQVSAPSPMIGNGVEVPTTRTPVRSIGVSIPAFIHRADTPAVCARKPSPALSVGFALRHLPFRWSVRGSRPPEAG